MDFEFSDLLSKFNQLLWSDSSEEELSYLQISINHGGVTKYKFVRSPKKSILFYHGNDLIQECTNHKVIFEFVQQFLRFNAGYEIVWHHQNQQGISTPYSDESFFKLLELLISDEVV